jgi:lysyl-tRNA synthetase class 2
VYTIKPQPGEKLPHEVKQRAKVVDELREIGVEPFDPPKFVPTHASTALLESMPPAEDEAACTAMEGETFLIAGRVMSKRRQGKAGFLHVQDRHGRIQGYVKRDDVGEDNYELYKKTYVGDWVGLEGGLMRTKTGETTVSVRKYHLLSKAMRPLPEKWHGLKDKEVRYRQRYLDLASNPDVRDAFVKRSLVMRELRRFFDDMDFLEVENPTLHSIAGGAEARPFVTHHNALGMDFYLRIAHELHLKRLIVGGLDKVYEIGKVFRNEGVSLKHNPEFTLFEAYWAYADYEDWMDTVEKLLRRLAEVARGNARFEYQGREIDLESPWRRVSYDALLQEHAGVSLAEMTTREDALAVAERLGVEHDPAASHGKIIDNVFSGHCEEHLWSPTFVYDYPLALSPLAKRKTGEEHVTARFEGFVARMEVCNAFSELTDPADQRERLEAQHEAKDAGDDEAHSLDEDFVLALEHGMPPTGGIGIGLERLLMILLGVESIRDVILFPHMKPVDGEGPGGEE